MARRERRVNGRCEACRRSKVRCDEEKPRCHRCTRNRLECRYPDRSKLRFCDQTDEVASLYLPGSPDSTSTASSGVRGLRQEASLQWDEYDEHGTSLSLAIDPGDAITRAGVVSILGRYCFTDRSIFSECCPCPPADYHMLPTIGKYSGSWSPCAYVISALAFTRCSLVTGDPDIGNQGLEMYQRGLESIRKALSRKSTRFEPDTVLAVCIIGLYEALSPATATNGQTHMSAFVNIIKLMGPARMREEPMHGIFRLCRINSLINACERGRRTFFADKSWCTIPFELTGKPPNQQFLDLYAELCTHMETLDMLEMDRESPKAEIEKRIQLQEACIDLQEKMIEFDPIFEREYGAPESLIVQDDWATSFPSPFDTPGFQEIFEYRSIDCAEVYMSYWTGRLKLAMAIRQNNELLLALLSLPSAANHWPCQENSGFPKEPADITSLQEQYHIPDTTDEELYMANSVARSVHYFVGQDNGIMGISPVMTPLHTAISWFETQPAWSERAQWCRDLLHQIPASQAYQLYRALKVSNVALRGDVPKVAFGT